MTQSLGEQPRGAQQGYGQLAHGAGLLVDEQVLLFRVQDVLCCADIEDVSALIRVPPFTKVPGASSAVVGIFNHRSQVLAAVSLRCCLALPEAEPSVGFVLLARLSQGEMGFWVDDVLDIVSPPQDWWRPVPPTVSVPFCRRVLVRDDGIFICLKLEQLVDLLLQYKSPDVIAQMARQILVAEAASPSSTGFGSTAPAASVGAALITDSINEGSSSPETIGDDEETSAAGFPQEAASGTGFTVTGAPTETEQGADDHPEPATGPAGWRAAAGDVEASPALPTPAAEEVVDGTESIAAHALAESVRPKEEEDQLVEEPAAGEAGDDSVRPAESLDFDGSTGRAGPTTASTLAGREEPAVEGEQEMGGAVRAQADEEHFKEAPSPAASDDSEVEEATGGSGFAAAAEIADGGLSEAEEVLGEGEAAAAQGDTQDAGDSSLEVERAETVAEVEPHTEPQVSQAPVGDIEQEEKVGEAETAPAPEPHEIDQEEPAQQAPGSVGDSVGEGDGLALRTEPSEPATPMGEESPVDASTPATASSDTASEEFVGPAPLDVRRDEDEEDTLEELTQSDFVYRPGVSPKPSEADEPIFEEVESSAAVPPKPSEEAEPSPEAGAESEDSGGGEWAGSAAALSSPGSDSFFLLPGAHREPEEGMGLQPVPLPRPPSRAGEWLQSIASAVVNRFRAREVGVGQTRERFEPVLPARRKSRAVWVGGAVLALILLAVVVWFSPWGGSQLNLPAVPPPPRPPTLVEIRPRPTLPARAAAAEEGIAAPVALPPTTPEEGITAPVALPATTPEEGITVPVAPPLATVAEQGFAIHVVVWGDTLSKISRTYLGDMMRYPELAEGNQISNPDLIYVGDVVLIRPGRIEKVNPPKP